MFRDQALSLSLCLLRTEHGHHASLNIPTQHASWQVPQLLAYTSVCSWIRLFACLSAARDEKSHSPVPQCCPGGGGVPLPRQLLIQQCFSLAKPRLTKVLRAVLPGQPVAEPPDPHVSSGKPHGAMAGLTSSLQYRKAANLSI